MVDRVLQFALEKREIWTGFKEVLCGLNERGG